MGSTNKERVLDYVWAASPGGTTNSEIQRETGIISHQQVYLLTRELMGQGWIRGAQCGRERVFWADESVAAQLSSPGGIAPGEPYLGPRDWTAFAERARQAMSAHLGVALAAGVLPGVSRAFEMVSPDRDIVGCALYLAPVQRQRLPLAKFALIGERVWLLDKIDARKFLIFGHDRDVPLLWLRRYGSLVSGVRFYYLDDDGTVERLGSQDGEL